MARTVTEWIGKTDDASPPKACRRRIVDRQNGICALSGEPFTPKDVIEFDHITPLWLHGENRESNLQAVKGEPHKRKTKAEATVRAKVYAAKDRHLGLKSKKRPFPSRPKAARPKRDQLPISGPPALMRRVGLWPVGNSEGD